MSRRVLTDWLWLQVTSVSAASALLPKAGTSTRVELFSSTVGISADIASMNIALAESVEYLGLKSLNISGKQVGGPWNMQASHNQSAVECDVVGLC